MEAVNQATIWKDQVTPIPWTNSSTFQRKKSYMFSERKSKTVRRTLTRNSKKVWMSGPYTAMKDILLCANSLKAFLSSNIIVVKEQPNVEILVTLPSQTEEAKWSSLLLQSKWEQTKFSFLECITGQHNSCNYIHFRNAQAHRSYMWKNRSHNELLSVYP